MCRISHRVAMSAGLKTADQLETVAITLQYASFDFSNRHGFVRHLNLRRHPDPRHLQKPWSVVETSLLMFRFLICEVFFPLNCASFGQACDHDHACMFGS